MRNAKLTILATLSLVMYVAMAWGYVGLLGLSIEYVWATPSGKTGRAVSAHVQQGRFIVEEAYSNPNPQNAALPLGLRFSRNFRLNLPLAPNWPWGFDISRYIVAPGYGGTHAICPLWFAALPFTIAPLVWLRRRRRREMRGFAVEGSQPLSEHVEMQTDRQTPTGV